MLSIHQSSSKARLFLMHGNRAIRGGGIMFSSSKLSDTMNSQAEISLISNQADYGGALYVVDNEVSAMSCSVSGCFFQDATTNLTMVFSKNQASMNGSDLYGGLLDRCMLSNSTGMSVLEPIGTSYFKKISNINSFDTVSSDPVRLCLCRNEELNCNKWKQSI